MGPSARSAVGLSRDHLSWGSPLAEAYPIGVAHTLERQEYKGLTFWVQLRTTSMGHLVKLLPVVLA